MLELKKISKTFNSGTVNEKCALHELSLSVPDGDFITIIGANGAGKSTLFGAISGSFLTDSGEILLDGQDVTFLPEFQRAKVIGRLFQDPMRGSAPGMTIEENLALAAGRSGWLGHISRRDRECFRAQLRELDMGLEDRLRQPVGLLSGGQRQALTLLMATIAKPKLLLLDEHIAALDPGAAEKILAMTTRIAAEQKLTCLMVTHNMRAALALGNRTLMMNNGQILLDVSGEERAHMSMTCSNASDPAQAKRWTTTECSYPENCKFGPAEEFPPGCNFACQRAGLDAILEKREERGIPDEQDGFAAPARAGAVYLYRAGCGDRGRRGFRRFFR